MERESTPRRLTPVEREFRIRAAVRPPLHEFDHVAHPWSLVLCSWFFYPSLSPFLLVCVVDVTAVISTFPPLSSPPASPRLPASSVSLLSRVRRASTPAAGSGDGAPSRHGSHVRPSTDRAPPGCRLSRPLRWCRYAATATGAAAPVCLVSPHRVEHRVSRGRGRSSHAPPAPRGERLRPGRSVGPAASARAVTHCLTSSARGRRARSSYVPLCAARRAVFRGTSPRTHSPGRVAAEARRASRRLEVSATIGRRPGRINRCARRRRRPRLDRLGRPSSASSRGGEHGAQRPSTRSAPPAPPRSSRVQRAADPAAQALLPQHRAQQADQAAPHLHQLRARASSAAGRAAPSACARGRPGRSAPAPPHPRPSSPARATHTSARNSDRPRSPRGRALESCATHSLSVCSRQHRARRPPNSRLTRPASVDPPSSTTVSSSVTIRFDYVAYANRWHHIPWRLLLRLERVTTCAAQATREASRFISSGPS